MEMDTEIEQYEFDLIDKFIEWCIECEVSPTGNEYSSKDQLIYEFLKKDTKRNNEF